MGVFGGRVLPLDSHEKKKKVFKKENDVPYSIESARFLQEKCLMWKINR